MQDAVHTVVRTMLSLVLIGPMLTSSFPSPAWGVSYDIVYVRAPRYGDTTNTRWHEVCTRS